MQVQAGGGWDNRYIRAGRKANGWLVHGTTEVPLWVYDVSVPSFSLAGSTAQSARTRSYFAHNAVQPSITIVSQFPSQKAYAEVAEFVRMTHLNLGKLPRIEIIARYPEGSNKHRNNKYGRSGRNTVWPHQSIAAWGYVRTIPRQHERHEYAPEMRFDFVVKRWIAPAAWADSGVTIRKLKSWHDIVEGILKNDKQSGFVVDPDADAETQPYTPPHPNGAGKQFGGPAQ